jgi:hypothetical protein
MTLREVRVMMGPKSSGALPQRELSYSLVFLEETGEEVVIADRTTVFDDIAADPHGIAWLISRAVRDRIIKGSQPSTSEVGN